MRIFLLFLLFLTSIFAKDLNATYKVSFGIFGQIGIAKTSLHVKDKRYKITVHAKSTGFASFISGGRQEWYESKGKIEDGLFVPDTYEKIVQRKVNVAKAFSDESIMETKRYVLIYTFNHKAKTVIATKIKTQGKEKSKHSEKVKFYTKNDLLSLFFNFKTLFPSLDIKKHYILHAVGANKDTGKIDVFPLAKKDFSDLISGDLTHIKLMKVILSDKIFASNSRGLCEKAVLKDVILFGDIRGELIEKNY